MELENEAARQTYIKLLADTLRKKTEVLKKLMELTKLQEDLLASEHMNEDDFLRLVTLKGEQLEILTKLDDGFEQLYQSVKEELASESDKYRNEITALKELITVITDISVELQTTERRNKARIEAYLSDKRKEIRNSRISSEAVTNYYKTMAKQHVIQPIFYDRKK